MGNQPITGNQHAQKPRVGDAHHGEQPKNSPKNGRASGQTPASGKYEMLCAPRQRKNCLTPISLVVFLLAAIRSGTCHYSPACAYILWGDRHTKFHSISILFLVEYFFPEGKWAALGGSAIPRQPVAGTRQASFPQPSSKNQFNI